MIQGRTKGRNNMSNFRAKFILVISLIVLGGVPAADAQANGAAIKANIQFDFVLRDKTYPAGEYTIQRSHSSIDSPSLLVLRGENESAIFDTITSISSNRATSTQLVFENADGVYFLSKIRVKGSDTGSEVIRTKSESRQIAKATSKKSITVGP
jgi:hypothetical protein